MFLYKTPFFILKRDGEAQADFALNKTQSEIGEIKIYLRKSHRFMLPKK